MMGEQDKVTPPELSLEVAQAIAGAPLRVIPGAGHLANIETRHEFNRLVDEFVREAEAAA